MRFRPKKLLALLLAGLMLFSATACGQSDESEETKAPPDTEAVTEADTGYKPDIEKTDYACDFIITGNGNIRSWAIADEDSTGDPFQDAIYERAIRVKDHLGVTLVDVDAGSWTEYAGNVIRTVQAGTDEYQLVSTHVYQGVVELLSSGGMLDFTELDGVNLDAPYWDMAYMEDLTIGDKYLAGYNDFCLSEPFCMIFNKDLTEEYNLNAPYQEVRDMKWTLDKMISFVSTISRDNGDNVWNEQDTYGISSGGWVDFIGFVQSSDMKIVAKDSEGTYQIAYDDNNEKTLALLETLCEVYDAEYSWFSSPHTEREGKGIGFGSGRVLLSMTTTAGLTNLRGEALRFGVLPYPLYDEDQDAYHSLNWNGIIAVPSTVRNRQMVGETLELLAYYTNPVKVAYYEDLLGTKLADAPDDAEMLEIIWDSQISDAGLITANLLFPSMDYLLYLVPNICREGIGTYSSYLKKYMKPVNKALDNFFNPRRKG